ncbi:uncharacterized protein [Arachis hypogaea]|uniref:uncharacterized protein n=1 Tax=Arachis hypogaea TaxID=3818 RepID=UPI0011057511|nr:uncharacterized protein LOC112742890 [Arachis hypogaea]
MEKYFKRTLSLEIGSQNNSSTSSNKRRFLEFEVESLIADPGQRPKISSYHPNDRDKVRCAYLQKGPCQPRNHDFPQTACGSSFRRFNPNWFDDYGNWLEYSISKDAVFCLCCYLMKPETEGGDAFVTNGFSNWKKRERLQTHVGIHDSAHNQAWRKCEALMKPKQHISVAIEKQSEQAKKNYQIHLTATIDCIRFLLRQGLAFRGNDETDDSVNQGNFLELLNFLALSRVRGQGYDGAIGASCKRRDMLRDSQMTKTIEALQSGEIASGRGLNQEIALKRAGDTRWGSHYGTILRLISLFPSVIRKLNNRFTEVNTELLLCIACLNPRHSFLAFDKEKLIQLAQFYPLEFSSTQLLALDSQLENFILDVRSDDQFSNLNGIGALSQKLVETRKNIVYPLVFLLLKLALVLPVATASVERTFSAMNIIKSRLRNRMGDEFLNDCLVTYIERETFDCIDNEKIIQSFQNMKPRRMEF